MVRGRCWGCCCCCCWQRIEYRLAGVTPVWDLRRSRTWGLAFKKSARHVLLQRSSFGILHNKIQLRRVPWLVQLHYSREMTLDKPRKKFFTFSASFSVIGSLKQGFLRAWETIELALIRLPGYKRKVPTPPRPHTWMGSIFTDSVKKEASYLGNSNWREIQFHSYPIAVETRVELVGLQVGIGFVAEC